MFYCYVITGSTTEPPIVWLHLDFMTFLTGLMKELGILLAELLEEL